MDNFEKLDIIDKKLSQAYGQKHLNLLKQRTEILKQNAQHEEELYKAQMFFLMKDKGDVLANFGNAQFDEYGNISNYTQLASTATEQQLKVLEQYEETLQLTYEQQGKVIDAYNQIHESELEQIQYSIDLKFDLKDLELDNIEHLLSNLSDDAADAAKKFALMGRSAAANIEKAEASVAAIEETLALSGFTADEISQILSNPENMATLLEGKELTEGQVEALKNYVSNLRESSEALRELKNQIPEILLAAFEDMNEELDKSISKIEHMQNLVEGYANIIELAGEEFLGINPEIMKQMRETQLAMAKTQLLQLNLDSK